MGYLSLPMLQVLQLGLLLQKICLCALEFIIVLNLEVFLYIQSKVLHEGVALVEVLLQWQLMHKEWRRLLGGKGLLGLAA